MPITRELGLFEVLADRDARRHVIETATVFRGRVLDISDRSVMVEATGTSEELDALYELLADLGRVRFVRTGAVWVEDESAQRTPRAVRPSDPRPSSA